MSLSRKVWLFKSLMQLIVVVIAGIVDFLSGLFIATTQIFNELLGIFGRIVGTEIMYINFLLQCSSKAAIVTNGVRIGLLLLHSLTISLF